MQEIWKDIRGYEGYYQVSNFGNVRSMDRVDSYCRNLKGRILKLSNGIYKSVTLSINNVCKNYNVHRLVAEAFIPNPDNLPCINHKDEDKHNNNVNNLEWCTYGYNNNYSELSKKASLARMGKPLSQEHKRHISDTLKKNAPERIAKKRKTMHERYPNGLKQTEESNRKRSDALKGKPKSEETKQKMRKPKSPETVEKMRLAQRRSHEARKLGITYQEYLKQLDGQE